MSKYLTLSIIINLFIISLNAQEISKKPLTHDDYDSWKSLGSVQISDDGEIISYEINPQKGDGYLYILENNSKKPDSILRGDQAKISAVSDFVAFNIKPGYDTIRKAKLKELKKDKMPKDSLGIWLRNKDSVLKFANIKSFKVPEKESGWMAFIYEKIEEETNDTISKADTNIKADSASNNKNNNSKKNKIKSLKIIKPSEYKEFDFEDIEEYTLSKFGNMVGMIKKFGDSIDSVSVDLFNTKTQDTINLINTAGIAKKISLNDNGTYCSFIYSSDTIKEKLFELRLYNVKEGNLSAIIDTSDQAMPENWSVSQHANLKFSEDNNRLYFGTAPIVEPEPEDTLTDDEKVSVDIWNWKDATLQPQQLKNLKNEKKRFYTALWHIDEKKMVQLADKELKYVSYDLKNNKKIILGYTYEPYKKLLSWEASRYKDNYLVNQKTGERKLILKKTQSHVRLSPEREYIVWYNAKDSNWHSYIIETGERINLTKGLDVRFYDEEFDMPNEPYPYGFAGWAENGDKAVVYDKFDLWILDPSGRNEAVNITSSMGRDNNISFRYRKLDPDAKYLPKKHAILRAFNKNSKQSGYYKLNLKKGVTESLIVDDYNFYGLKKAENSDVICFRKGSFNEYPELYSSTTDFQSIDKLTHTNPQQKDYLWGNVELVSWTSFNGEELEGLLYKPENFDPEKKYPMIVYFYETYSNSLHRHYTPKPSRSVINFTYYLSNGYLIFIPDIKYRTGYPGQSAYDAIISGTKHISKNPWVDAKNIGIQGQSWGGYQVAYLVTQTNIYKAAMAGAPVSNMTSAYGGIRWGSGMSRMFQYEESQSRIGGTLWEKPFHYIENSPLFYAPKINTPLLIMHNDNDGAVPWYQGIELFVALRRLNKPVWLLNYNGAPHNLKRRADCKDLTIRMQQFFDHYLKGAPEPVWMAEGIPALKKGKEFGFELIEEN